MQLGRTAAVFGFWIFLACAAQAAEPLAGSIWVEPKTGMEFVWIPTGCFIMGSDDGNMNEIPLHKVCVKGFYLGKYKVTQAQYQKITINHPNRFKRGSLPVKQVSFQDIEGSLEAFNYQTGGQFRLPSEAEWEYACRAGRQHSEYCSAASVNILARHKGNSSNKTHLVRRRRPNAWGLYDLDGKLLEWTEDCWHEDYAGAPTDGRPWHGENGGNCRWHVLRGGSWKANSPSAQAAFRDGFDTTDRKGSFGFRLARTLP